MEEAVEGYYFDGAPEVSRPPHDMPRLSMSEFPPLTREEFKRNIPCRSMHPQGGAQAKNTLSADENNNGKPTARTAKEEMKKRKFRPAGNLFHFICTAGDGEEDSQAGHSYVDIIRADVLRDLEEMYQEYPLPDWNCDGKLPRRTTRGKLRRRSMEGRYVRGKFGALPHRKGERFVNCRTLFRRNELVTIFKENRERRKRNTEKNMDSKGLRRGTGSERYRIDIGALNEAMPQTTAQQRTRRNAIGGILRNDVHQGEPPMRPSTLIRRRRNARWGPTHVRDQELHQFELHHDNIACLAPDIKNEDDLWQIMNIQHRELTPEDYDLLLQLDESVAPKTVSEETLSNLRVATVGEAELAGELSEQLCSICIEGYSVGEKVKYLPCGHFYHEKCIDNWLTFSDSKCPLDGYEIS